LGEEPADRTQGLCKPGVKVNGMAYSGEMQALFAVASYAIAAIAATSASTDSLDEMRARIAAANARIAAQVAL